MTVWSLAARELLHRRVNAALSVLAVTVAVACMVGATALLQAHDRRTDALVAAKEAQTREAMATMEDDYRKITKRMGFNVMIMPKAQDLGDFYNEGFAAKTMPEAYVDRLAKSRLVTVQHLLPSLQQKVLWPEQKRTILLMGTRGEVPGADADAKKPILPAIANGSIVLGYELHQSLKLKVGDEVQFLGRGFKVSQLHEARGSKDDITAWVDLAAAQELLDKPGQINAILALECQCAWADLPKVRAEIGKILPDTNVIEFRSQALARAEARLRAAEAARSALEAEKAHRATLRQEREALATVMAPLCVLGCGVWVGLLALANVRERRSEIGILRTFGLRRAQVLQLFVARALLIGLLGAAIGAAGGALVGMFLADREAAPPPLAALLEPRMILTVVLAAPLLAALASWIPALLATRQDPAVALRET